MLFPRSPVLSGNYYRKRHFWWYHKQRNDSTVFGTSFANRSNTTRPTKRISKDIEIRVYASAHRMIRYQKNIAGSSCYVIEQLNKICNILHISHILNRTKNMLFAVILHTLYIWELFLKGDRWFINEDLILFYEKMTEQHQTGGILEGQPPLAEPSSLLVVQIIIILSMCRVLGSIFKRIREPTVCAEIIVGILLGPSAFGTK